MRERFPGFRDVELSGRVDPLWCLIAWAWHGRSANRSFTDAVLDDARSLTSFFEENLRSLHDELAPEAA